MNMPKVSECEMSECSYNRQGQCHALAITIGNSGTPRCDTFCTSPTEGGEANATAGVGACKTTSCVFNSNLECSAPSIRVSRLSRNEADCATYKSR